MLFYNRSLAIPASKIYILCWLTINVLLVWTALFHSYTIFSNISLFILIAISLLNFNSLQVRELVKIVLFVLLLASISYIQGNNVSLILRFGIVTFSILFAYFIRLPKRLLLRVLFYTSLPYCILILLAEFYFLLFCSESDMNNIRGFILGFSNPIGDIYLKYGLFYAIQLVGSAAIPFLFLLSFYSDLFPVKYKRICRFIYCLTIFFVGNFAFLVTLFLFLIYYTAASIKTRCSFRRAFILIILLLPLLSPACYTFVKNVLDEKKQISNATRLDQMEVLFHDLHDNVFTTFFGKGIGNTINVQTKYRDYKDLTYYELQSLYCLNQYGYLFFLIFIVWNYVYIVKYIPNKHFRVIYLLYTTYAITNPYIFNTNQIVVIITLVSLCHNEKRKYICCNSSLQSKS